MAQVKLLKIDVDGIPVEADSAADELTLASFTVQGGGPVLGATGLDLNNQDVSDVNDLAFNNPATGTINQTAGALIIDNIVAKDRGNLFTAAADLTFPVVTDAAGEIDAFRLPAIAGAPTATPATGGAGHLVYDSTGKNLYAWTGTDWDNLNTVAVASSIDDSYTAAVAIAARDVVYISAADSVTPASASSATAASAVGFATAAALSAAAVNVRKFGRLAGFSSLTPGARYYLGTTAGGISATVPVGAGNTIVQVGYAKSATTLDIMIQGLGRRAA